MDLIITGTVASIIAGVGGTGLGALFVLFVPRLSATAENMLLASAAGVMLAATFFSLLLPAIDFGTVTFGSELGAVCAVIVGLGLGGLLLSAIHHLVPHEHFGEVGREGPDQTRLKQIWLFILAITLHNFPEGMAVGVGFAGGDAANGQALMTGIGIQNIPEGLAVALSLTAIGYRRVRAFLIAAATGLAEPVGGFFGSVAISVAEPALSIVLATAAGAMLFVISNEIIPETHRTDRKGQATWALMAGFAVMMALDATLG